MPLAEISAKARNQTDRETFWRSWLASRLPEGLSEHVAHIVERDKAVTVYTRSPAWSARLRYAMHDLSTELHQVAPNIEIRVRVMPAGDHQ